MPNPPKGTAKGASKGRMVIIDGSGYIFRAYYALQQKLTSPDGIPVNAVLGFVNMLLKTIEDLKPDHLAITFDTGKPTFRKKLYDAYKANRSAPPEDLVPQFDIIQEAVDSFGIPRLQMEGYEADDVIGTVAKRALEEGYVVEVVTADKDLMQLVSDQICLVDTMRNGRVDRSKVFEKFQVGPEQVVEVLALMGDTSDNIPGVKGIGPKTAAELIQKYGSVEGLYKNIDDIKQEKRRQVLVEHKEMALLSRKLVEIDCQVPIDIDWEKFLYKDVNRDTLEPFLRKYGFQAILKRLGFVEKVADKFEGAQYKSVTTEADLKNLVEKLKKAKFFAIDTETTSLVVHNAECVGISISIAKGEAYYIPSCHVTNDEKAERVPGQQDWKNIERYLKPVLEDPEIGKIGQNIKYDLQIFRRHGIELRGIVADTMIESYLVNPEQSHGMDALALKYLQHKNISYEDVTGKGKSQISFAAVDLQKATEYAAEDADVTLRLHETLFPELEKHGLGELFSQVEMPLIEVLADMEYTGVLVDKERLEKMSQDLQAEMGILENQIFALAGGAININSPKQLSALLFEKLKLPIIKKTKTGISTDESVLRALAPKHEICEQILKYREYGKLRSTFVEGLLGQIHSRTTRVHTSFNQAVTATGRLSSSNPNLQNIPVGAEAKYDVRSAFIGAPGCELISADYSQVELRLLAHMSEDPELLRSFHAGEDVHARTGKLIFGLDNIDSDQRRIAKTINFGVIYGQTPFGLSKTLGISMSEAKKFIDTYFQRYKGVYSYLKNSLEVARSKGYAITLMGRRRYLPEIHSENRMIREMAERTAINTPLQGTAADMIKAAMVAVHRELKAQNLKSKLILQVHDELVLEVPSAEKRAVEALVKREMENALQLKVPLLVDIGWGINWQSAKS